MSPTPTFQVLLLPRQEVAARGCTLAEARAWMQAYNQVMLGSAHRAVIAEEPEAQRQPALSQVA